LEQLSTRAAGGAALVNRVDEQCNAEGKEPACHEGHYRNDNGVATYFLCCFFQFYPASFT